MPGIDSFGFGTGFIVGGIVIGGPVWLGWSAYHDGTIKELTQKVKEKEQKLAQWEKWFNEEGKPDWDKAQAIIKNQPEHVNLKCDFYGGVMDEQGNHKCVATGRKITASCPTGDCRDCENYIRHTGVRCPRCGKNMPGQDYLNSLKLPREFVGLCVGCCKEVRAELD